MPVANKKHPADAKAIVGKEESPVNVKGEVAASNVVIKTTGDVEIVKEVPASQTPAADPLGDFKEKMVQEEKQPPNNEPVKKNYMWPILFIFIVAIALLVGIFVYRQGIFKGGKASVVTLSPTPTIVPEPTKAIDLTQYEIEIQNGSEIDGEAGRQKINLEEEGFTVVSVGNADNSDYTDTIVKAKADAEKGFLDKLNSVLEKTFTLGSPEILPDDSTVSVIVVLGTQK